MLNVLHRTTHEPAVLDRPIPEIERRTPPPAEPPAGPEPASRWPFGAKVVVAVLAVLALAGGVGTIVGFNSGGDDSTSELQASINDLSAERDLLRAARDDAVDRASELEASLTTLTRNREQVSNELAAANATVADLEASLVSLTRSREVVSNELAAANATVAGLQASLTTLNRSRELVSNQLAAVQTQLAATQAELAEVEADLAAQIDLTEAAVTERDALAALFPLSFDATLAQVDLAGDYDVEIAAVYCEGFANCTALPDFDELTIVETSQGWLRVEIDGYLDAGLFLVDGSLYAIAGSTTAVPECNAVPRDATVSMTIYAQGLTVADDGSHVIDTLGASLMVEAPDTGTCDRGLAFFGLELTPAT